MTNISIEEAILKIKELGFNAIFWNKHRKKRIYIDFTFNGSKVSGGFISSENSQAVAANCGRKTKDYQDKLDAISNFQIDWYSNEPKTLTVTQAARKVAYEVSMESNYHELGIGFKNTNLIEQTGIILKDEIKVNDKYKKMYTVDVFGQMNEYENVRFISEYFEHTKRIHFVYNKNEKDHSFIVEYCNAFVSKLEALRVSSSLLGEIYNESLHLYLEEKKKSNG